MEIFQLVEESSGTTSLKTSRVPLFSWITTQSEGSEFGCLEGYEQTSSKLACVGSPTSPKCMVQDAFVSSGDESPPGKGSS